MWCKRLPLGTAEGPPGAARLKVCVRTWLYFSASRGRPLLDNERTAVVSNLFGHTYWSTKKVYIQHRIFVRVLELTFSLIISRQNLRRVLEIASSATFRGKIEESSEKVRVRTFAERSWSILFLRNFFIFFKHFILVKAKYEKGFHILQSISQGFFTTDLEGVIHSRLLLSPSLVLRSSLGLPLDFDTTIPVSYTHLTLPTIYSV